MRTLIAGLAVIALLACSSEADLPYDGDNPLELDRACTSRISEIRRQGNQQIRDLVPEGQHRRDYLESVDDDDKIREEAVALQREVRRKCEQRMSEITGVPTATELYGRWRYTGPECDLPSPGCITHNELSTLYLQAEGHHPLNPLLPPTLILHCGSHGLEVFYKAGLDVGDLAMGDLLLDLGDGGPLRYSAVRGQDGYSVPEPSASEIVNLFLNTQHVSLEIQGLDSSTNTFDLTKLNFALDLLPCAK